MSGRYDDIIHLPHHVSPKRKRLSMVERGAQFSPFAALTGYEAAIQETGRMTDCEILLDADEKTVLDEKLRFLYEHRKEKPEITITYFVPDEWKDGGAYKTVKARLKAVDPNRKALLLEDGTVVYFERIRELWGEGFRLLEKCYFAEGKAKEMQNLQE